MNNRIPAIPKTRHVHSNVASYSKALKTLWRKAGRPGSLKQFVSTSEDSQVKDLGPDWLYNKKANFSKPPLGLGNTKKKKK